MTKHLTQKQATELWTARIKEMQASMRKDIVTKTTYDGGEKYKEGPTGKQEAKKGLYFYVNRAKKRGTSRPKDHPDAPTAQDWKNAAKTAKKEEMGMTAASAGIPHDTKNMGPRDVTDKRYKKNKPPVIKRGFKSYIGM